MAPYTGMHINSGAKSHRPSGDRSLSTTSAPWHVARKHSALKTAMLFTPNCAKGEESKVKRGFPQ